MILYQQMGKCLSNIYLPELKILFLLFILAQVLHSNQVRTWTDPAKHIRACSVQGLSVWPNVNQSPVQCSQILGKNLTKLNFGTTNMNAFGLISELWVSAFRLLLLQCGLRSVTTCSMQVRWPDLLRWWIQLPAVWWLGNGDYILLNYLLTTDRVFWVWADGFSYLTQHYLSNPDPQSWHEQQFHHLQQVLLA